MQKRSERSFGRAIAIPLIGLGAATCSSIEYVQSRWPEYSATPAMVGMALAMLGLLLLYRHQTSAVREQAARKDEWLRIAPYVPEMADGSDGAELLKQVVAPTPLCTAVRSVSAPVGRMPAREPIRHRTAPAPIFHSPTPPLRPLGARKALCSALRLGSELSRDLKISPRAMERADADPFVQRLARLS